MTLCWLGNESIVCNQLNSLLWNYHSGLTHYTGRKKVTIPYTSAVLMLGLVNLYCTGESCRFVESTECTQLSSLLRNYSSRLTRYTGPNKLRILYILVDPMLELVKMYCTGKSFSMLSNPKEESSSSYILCGAKKIRRFIRKKIRKKNHARLANL